MIRWRNFQPQAALFRSGNTSSSNNRYTYTGREWDAGLSLYHFRARMYDPAAGRFVSRDPIGYTDGANSYAHLLGETLTSTDPTGLCKEGWNGSACVNYSIWVEGVHYAESDLFNDKWWINRGAYFSGTVTIFASFNDSINCCCPERSVQVNINNRTTLNVRYYQVSTRLTTIRTAITSLFGPLWVKAMLYSATSLDIAENLKQAADVRDKAGNAIELTPSAVCIAGIAGINAYASQTFSVRSGDPPGGFPNLSTERRIWLTHSGKTCEN